MNIKRPKRKGWQFREEREEEGEVEARTWAKIREEEVAAQMLWRLGEFQAGEVEVKMQGGGVVKLVVVAVSGEGLEEEEEEEGWCLLLLLLFLLLLDEEEDEGGGREG